MNEIFQSEGRISNIIKETPVERKANISTVAFNLSADVWDVGKEAVRLKETEGMGKSWVVKITSCCSKGS